MTIADGFNLAVGAIGAGMLFAVVVGIVFALGVLVLNIVGGK